MKSIGGCWESRVVSSRREEIFNEVVIKIIERDGGDGQMIPLREFVERNFEKRETETNLILILKR